jgi:zinc ribbon protein
MSLNQGSSVFSPPEGLQPNEQVLWVTQTEIQNQSVSGPIILALFGGLFFVTGFFFNAIPVLAIGILILIGAVGIGYQYKKQGGVRYYLTNFRFVKVNHGKIMAELPRRMFRGKSFQQFLSIFKAPLQKGPIEMYAVQVLNPDTGNVAMNLGLMPGEVVKRLESINEEVYCQYCGRKNDPTANICSNCGANL